MKQISPIKGKISGACALATALLMLSAAGAAMAHHSFAAAYNMENPLELTGKINNVRLTNPHSHFFIDVEDEEGNVVTWKIEAGTPGAMIRHGYTTEVFKKGETVTIRGFHARNGSSNGMLQEIETDDGRVWGMFAPVQGGSR